MDYKIPPGLDTKTQCHLGSEIQCIAPISCVKTWWEEEHPLTTDQLSLQLFRKTNPKRVLSQQAKDNGRGRKWFKVQKRLRVCQFKKDRKKRELFLMLSRKRKQINTHTHTWTFSNFSNKMRTWCFQSSLKASSLSLSCWIYNAKKQNPRNLFLFT